MFITLFTVIPSRASASSRRARLNPVTATFTWLLLSEPRAGAVLPLSFLHFFLRDTVYLPLNN